jgi:hypothetical protein
MHAYSHIFISTSSVSGDGPGGDHSPIWLPNVATTEPSSVACETCKVRCESGGQMWPPSAQGGWHALLSTSLAEVEANLATRNDSRRASAFHSARPSGSTFDHQMKQQIHSHFTTAFEDSGTCHPGAKCTHDRSATHDEQLL